MAFLKPREVKADEIAERVAAFVAPEAAEGVIPLNLGFFQLEQMRMATGTKTRSTPKGLKG